MALILLWACGQTVTEAPEKKIELDDIQLLTRASLDLRGVRPSVEEINAVEADSAALEPMISSFVDDSRFGGRVRAMFSDTYLTRQDTWPVDAEAFDIDDEPGFAASVGEEPLRILSTIAEEDLPYTEIVTGDWTMANELLGKAFPVDYPEGSTGWQKVHYTDGRPSAGVLSSNGFWWHYTTNLNNSNRGRANAVSRVLLCNDYLSRPIEFWRDVNLLDREAINDALLNNSGCYACHATLDPMASYLWGFYYLNNDSRADASTYHPERELLWQETTGISPGYYGESGNSMTDLGWQIADDSRLPQCITEQIYQGLMGRENMLDDTASLTGYRETLLANDMKLKSLYRAIVAGPEYRNADPSDPTAAPRKMAGPELMATQVEGLTGFRFTTEGYDMMTTDSYGLRILAGGVDGVAATRPATEPTTTMVLVQERLSQVAAWYVLEQDVAAQSSGGTPGIFTKASLTADPSLDTAATDEQIRELNLRVLSRHVSDEELAEQRELLMGLYADEASAGEGAAGAAWAGLLSVLMRDPEFILY